MLCRDGFAAGQVSVGLPGRHDFDVVDVDMGRERDDPCNDPRDVVARFGGEEFVILLPETDAIGAQRVAKRCQRLIEKRAITHAQSPHGQLVTASIGLGTVMPNARMSTTDFLQAVDRQLYAAKQNGRNRIETGAL